MMNLYVVSQNENDNYDTYDSFVVACESEDAARSTHPSGIYQWDGEWFALRGDGSRYEESYTWTSPDKVSVKLIGTAAECVEGVVCASFNAG